MNLLPWEQQRSRCVSLRNDLSVALGLLDFSQAFDNTFSTSYLLVNS
jgi:hypothetical protein